MTLRNILLHFEFSNKALDLKCVTLSIISTWLCCVEMKRILYLHFSHNTTCLTPSTQPPPHPTPPPPKQKYCITFVFNVFWVLQLSQEKLETTLMQNLGNKQGALYLKRCGVGDHPLCPRFQIWRWPVGLNIRTIVSPSKTRRFWEEFVKPSCDN